jgi:hypothetical protein
MSVSCRWFFGLALAASICAPVWSQSKSGAPWGARAPAQCTPLKQSQPPSAVQAAQLLRCEKEKGSESTGELWLMENVNVEVGGPTTYAAMYQKIIMQEADTTKPVYPIRGSWTWSTCILRSDAGRGGADPNLNCREADVTAATGGCWRTTFNDWKCTMNGTTGSRSALVKPRQ